MVEKCGSIATKNGYLAQRVKTNKRLKIYCGQNIPKKNLQI